VSSIALQIGGLGTRPARATDDAPHLIFSSAHPQATLGAAYAAALENLLAINTVRYDSARYNRTGLLIDPPGMFVRAGGGYEQPWTRDASVNSWNAASLLEPEVARNTLWAVVERQPGGKLIVQQDNQWWDQVVWIVAAWNHYAITGDRVFLRSAYEAAAETLARAKAVRFRPAHGLFAGPAFFNDGIAGYPVPPATPEEDRGSFVLKYTHADEVIALSTNCLYTQSYVSAAAMARELGDDANASRLAAMAEALRKSINQHFWISRRHTYGYLIAPADGNSQVSTATLDEHQEGAGLGFALLFDIADPGRARDVLRNAQVDTHGIADVFPHFPRYSDERPGRHNDIVWPMVEGFWALGAARHRDESAFAREVSNLAELVSSSSGHFFEIYSAQTGSPDGGWQTGSHWKSQPDQTWSATAFLAMIYRGVFGMHFTPLGIDFEPLLPANWGDVALTGLRYRSMTLGIRLHGGGCAVTSFDLDGKRQTRPRVPAALEGAHRVDVTLRGGCVRSR
jgi:glycogen debranching enzyme